MIIQGKCWKKAEERINSASKKGGDGFLVKMAYTLGIEKAFETQRRLRKFT